MVEAAAEVPVFTPPHRILITGANGCGKTYFATALARARPSATVIHYDALKLTTDWVQRSPAESLAALDEATTGPEWILEGGPSMLSVAVPRADLIIWLDMPTPVRAARLLLRPFRSLGQTRPELPPGNPDHLGQQLGFGWRSLRHTKQTRVSIGRALVLRKDSYLVHCKTPRSARALLSVLTQPRHHPTSHDLLPKAL